MSHWDENYPVRELGHGKSVLLGMGLAMQGSCISGLDVGSAALKLNDEGFYIMRIAAADMGTGLVIRFLHRLQQKYWSVRLIK